MLQIGGRTQKNGISQDWFQHKSPNCHRAFCRHCSTTVLQGNWKIDRRAPKWEEQHKRKFEKAHLESVEIWEMKAITWRSPEKLIKDIYFLIKLRNNFRCTDCQALKTKASSLCLLCWKRSDRRYKEVTSRMMGQKYVLNMPCHLIIICVLINSWIWNWSSSKEF